MSNKYPIGGFAPGNYNNKCVSCGEIFLGDKRAVQCEPCAINGRVYPIQIGITKEEHQKEVDKLKKIEDKLISLIALSDNDELYETYLKWHKQRAKCNKGLVEILNSILGKS